MDRPSRWGTRAARPGRARKPLAPTQPAGPYRWAVLAVPFVVFLSVAFVGMGVFNGISTWVEEIVRPRGFSSGDAGTLGALLLLGGVVGTAVVFVLLMELTRAPSGSFTPPLVVLAVLLLVSALVVHRLPEPAHHLALRDVLANAGDREQDGAP